MSYKLLQNGGVQRLSDGASIPPSTGNRDWQEYQDWIAEGNTPLPADLPPPPPPPRQQIITRLRADPVFKAQVIESFEARGITDRQLMLDALETKFADPI